jgi:hypothetical protein
MKKKGTIQEHYPFLNLKIEHTKPRPSYKAVSQYGKDIWMPIVRESWAYDYISFASLADCYRYMIATVREAASKILIETEALNWQSYWQYAFLGYLERWDTREKCVEGHWLDRGRYQIVYPAAWSEQEAKRYGMIQLRKCCRRFLKNEVLP